MDSNTSLAQLLVEQCKQTKSLTLDLGYCGLRTIPEEVFELTWRYQKQA